VLSYTDQAVPPAVLEAFGSDRARPRVRWIYTADHGTQRLKPRPVLTTELAMRLRAEGVSRIELGWRWRRLRMRVTCGNHSVWGTDCLPLSELTTA
jgi:hypothetical protein